MTEHVRSHENRGPLRCGRIVTAVVCLFALAGHAALAEERKRPARVGFLGASHGMEESLAQSFVAAMRERGWIEGQNVLYLDRSARGRVENLPELARSLVREGADVIVAPPAPAALAARNATRTVPIVFLLVSDPVAAGLVESLARPGTNATGLFAQTEDLSSKMVEVLAEAVPKARRLAILANPDNVAHERLARQVAEAARQRGLRTERLGARDYDGVDRALDAIEALRPHGVVLLSDPIFVSRREAIARRFAEARLPAVYSFGEFAEVGGLMSYGVDLHAQFRKAAAAVDRILRGANPATMPVEQPARFELTVNVQAARRMGLELPREFLLRADRLIQ